jgi:hypothetical protein
VLVKEVLYRSVAQNNRSAVLVQVKGAMAPSSVAPLFWAAGPTARGQTVPVPPPGASAPTPATPSQP